VNNHFQKIALRFAAATGLLVGGGFVACSSKTEEPIAPPPPVGGSSSTAGSGSQTAGTGGTTSTGGGGAATGGDATGGTGGGNGCPAGQQKLPTGECGCPMFNPDYCATAGKCVNFTKNPDFCGSCDTKCGATNACVSSACTPDLTAVTEVAGCGKLLLVSAASKLYALSTMTGELSSVPVAGGAAVSIATGLTDAKAFAVDATNAYVVNGMKVSKVPLAGGAPVALVTETKPIYDVTVDATSIYYAVDEPDTAAAEPVYAGVIKKAPLAGGTGMVVGLGMDNGQPQGVTVSGMNILYATESSKNVEVQKGLPVGPDPHTDALHYKLGASQGSLIFGHRSIQNDGTYVYWASDNVYRSKFGEAAPVQAQAAGSLGLTTAFAINATSVYVGSDMGDLGKSPIGTDMISQLARGLGMITSIVVDDTSVYVAADCKILKAPL
jgi:hypothetical protein